MSSTYRSAEPPRLDEAALDRLREIDPEGRHGVVMRVLQAFERSLEGTLQQLSSLVGSTGTGTGTGASPQAVCIQRALDISHMLKSSAASVGALALANACAQVEQRQRVNPGLEIDHDLRRLITESERALVAVRAILRP